MSALAFTLSFAMCALGAEAAAQRQRFRVALPAFGAQVVLDTLGVDTEENAPVSRVFGAARVVLQNFKIPLDAVDSLGGTLAAIKLTRSRNIAGSALSRYLECGSGMTGPRADTHRVQMPLLILLDPLPNDRTKVKIALVGSAQDNSGTSTQPVMCGSTGVLESQIRKAIRDQLQQQP